MENQPEDKAAAEVPVKKIFKIEQLENRIVPSHLGIVVQLPEGAHNANHQSYTAVNQDPSLADASHRQARIIGLDNIEAV